MQAALQRFVDNSLSKTINFPAGASTRDVADAYTLAWKLGCKGITVYITGSREKVVLETASTANSKKPVEIAVQPDLWMDNKKPRPRSLRGYTYSIETPLGKAFVTINENGGNLPFEVFINTAKAGSDTAAVSEAIGRLISYNLRLASPVAGTTGGTAWASSCTLSPLRCGMAATLGMRLLCLLFRLLLLLLGSLRSAFDVMMAATGTGRCLSRRRTLLGCGF